MPNGRTRCTSCNKPVNTRHYEAYIVQAGKVYHPLCTPKLAIEEQRRLTNETFDLISADETGWE